MLRFLDSEMFRGNYRRLICVRYEDLKICDRRYGSESFNIVPGTEYLLPQHLEVTVKHAVDTALLTEACY